MSSTTSASGKELQEVFLSPDPRIPGQNYVCLSFACPEEVIKKKETFYLQNFINDLLNNPDRRKFLELTAGKQLTYEETDDLYKGYLLNNEEELDRVFSENNNFATSVRGVKVRGVYDTEREARNRSSQLQKRDPAFNIWVGKVGQWLPFNPDPAKMTDVEYNEERLNTLMAKKREADEHRDEVFTEEVKRKVAEANRETEALKQKVAAELSGTDGGADVADGVGIAPADTVEKLNELKEIMDESDKVYDKLIAEQRVTKAAGSVGSARSAGGAGAGAGASGAGGVENGSLFNNEDPWLSRRKVQAEKKDVSKDINNLF